MTPMDWFWKLVVLVVGMVVLLGGCGLTGAAARRQREAEERFRVKMENLVGHLTISQAIARLGPPTYERTDSSTSETILAWQEQFVVTETQQPPPLIGPPVPGFFGGMAQGAAAGLAMRQESTSVVVKNTLTLGFRDGVLAWWQCSGRCSDR